MTMPADWEGVGGVAGHETSCYCRLMTMPADWEGVGGVAGHETSCYCRLLTMPADWEGLLWSYRGQYLQSQKCWEMSGPRAH